MIDKNKERAIRVMELLVSKHLKKKHELTDEDLLEPELKAKIRSMALDILLRGPIAVKELTEGE